MEQRLSRKSTFLDTNGFIFNIIRFMNPEIRLENIADDNYEQVLGADHNGKTGRLVGQRILDGCDGFQLWAQEELVRGNCVFHYEQRAFHHLFQTSLVKKCWYEE